MLGAGQRRVLLIALFWSGVVVGLFEFSLSFVYMGEPLRYLGLPAAYFLGIVGFQIGSYSEVYVYVIPAFAFVGLGAGFFLSRRAAIASGMLWVILLLTGPLYLLTAVCLFTHNCL